MQQPRFDGPTMKYRRIGDPDIFHSAVRSRVTVFNSMKVLQTAGYYLSRKRFLGVQCDSRYLIYQRMLPLGNFCPLRLRLELRNAGESESTKIAWKIEHRPSFRPSVRAFFVVIASFLMVCWCIALLNIAVGSVELDVERLKAGFVAMLILLGLTVLLLRTVRIGRAINYRRAIRRYWNLVDWLASK